MLHEHRTSPIFYSEGRTPRCRFEVQWNVLPFYHLILPSKAQCLVNASVQQAATGTAGPSEDASVPADPAQPTCALSGERFDSAWDDATNGWRYLGAAALDAEQAERCKTYLNQHTDICTGPRHSMPM